jgi:hypothetical protein
MSAEALYRYAAWRRSTLLVVLVPTLLAALLATADAVGQGRQGLSRLGRALNLASTLVLWAMPVAAFVASLSWTRLRLSHRILSAGWVIAFLPPFAIALFPLRDWFEASPPDQGQQMEMAVLDAVNGLYVAFTLLPTALSVLPGLVRGCIRVKTLLPAAILPGWFLVAGPPFYLLLWLVGLVVLNHLAGSPLLVFGVLLWTGAPMAYVARADLFVQPLPEGESLAIRRVRRTANAAAMLGGLLLLAYLFTKQVFGLYLVGFVPEASLVWLWENAGEVPDFRAALSRATSLFWAGDVSLSQLIVQYFGRSLFVTTVFADVLVRMNLSLWRQEQEFSSTPDAVAYDAAMKELGRVLGPDVN